MKTNTLTSEYLGKQGSLVFLKKTPIWLTRVLKRKHGTCSNSTRRIYSLQGWAGQAGGGRCAPAHPCPSIWAESTAPGTRLALGPRGDPALASAAECGLGPAGRGCGRGQPSVGQGRSPQGEARTAQGPGQHSPERTAPDGDPPPRCRQGFSGSTSGGFCCGKTSAPAPPGGPSACPRCQGRTPQPG